MKITVLIPIFNTKPAALLESVYSILNQDCGIAAIEKIILINDGSTDGSTEDAISYLQAHFPDIIKVIDKPNGGTSSALNFGHATAQTDFVAIMGSDDISDKSRFRLQLDYLKKHPDTDVLGTNLFSFHNDDIRRKAIFTSTHRQIPTGASGDKRWLVNHGTVIYRQTAVMAVGGYNEKVGRAQDVELWKRMNDKGFKFRNVESVLYAWRRYK